MTGVLEVLPPTRPSLAIHSGLTDCGTAVRLTVGGCGAQTKAAPSEDVTQLTPVITSLTNCQPVRTALNRAATNILFKGKTVSI